MAIVMSFDLKYSETRVPSSLVGNMKGQGIPGPNVIYMSISINVRRVSVGELFTYDMRNLSEKGSAR